MALDVHALAETHPEDLTSFEVEQHGPSALARLRDELLDIGRLISTAVDLSQAAGSRGDTFDSSAVLRFLPPSPTAVPHVWAWLADNGAEPQLAAFLEAFWNDFSYVRTATVTLAQSAATSDAALAWSDLAAAWRGIAKSLLRVLGELRRLLDVRQTPAERSRLEWITATLEATSVARTAAAAGNGPVAPGIWPERRERNRSRVSTHILLQMHDSIQRALIVDASADGIGLWGVRDARPGDAVRLMVSPGWTVEGVIVWREGLRAGVYLVAGNPRDAEFIGGLILSRQTIEE